MENSKGGFKYFFLLFYFFYQINLIGKQKKKKVMPKGPRSNHEKKSKRFSFKKRKLRPISLYLEYELPMSY